MNRFKQYRHEIKGVQTESEGIKRETTERFQQMESQHADLHAVQETELGVVHIAWNHQQ